MHDMILPGAGRPASISIPRLRAAFNGRVVAPDDAGYDRARTGLTIDNLLAAELVTADGQILQVDDQHHPDLFWAIRGGGGNFGVATRFKFQLHKLPSIVGGMLLMPATAEVIAGFMAEADAAPEELSAIANLMPAPPAALRRPRAGRPAGRHGPDGLRRPS
jgi:FAD/FMN-containing dehydrogenase